MSISPTDLPVRKLGIALAAGFDAHWHSGDAYRSMYFNALSMSFPVGEQFFIDSVRAGTAALGNTCEHLALRQLSTQFIGQEATHRQLHAQFNHQLEQHALHNHWQYSAQRRVDRCRRLGLSALNQLAITAAYEHITATVAEATLGHQWLAGAEERLQLMWYWHASEELEHKSIAFDLYLALGGGAARRIAWYPYVWALFLFESTRQTVDNLRRDGSLWKMSTWRSGLGFWWGRHGLLRCCTLPLLAYLRPKFHPDDVNDRGIGTRWLEQHQDHWTRLK